MTLQKLYDRAATATLEAGIPCDDSPNGPVAAWVRQNCSYRPGTEFFIVVGIVGSMADELARREGFRDQLDRALANTTWGGKENPR